MIYWRIQMNQPDGRGGIQINSLDLLKESKPVIATGEWEDIQCEYFKGEHFNGIKTNDIILVHEGKTPIALCKITSDNFTDEELKNKYYHDNFRYVDVLGFYNGSVEFPATQGTIERFINDTKSRRFIQEFYQSIFKTKEMDDIIKVLTHKKQIILQGPPGTGKTRLAKQIAQRLCKNNKKDLFPYSDISKSLKNIDDLPSSSGRTKYTISDIRLDRCKVSLESGTSYDIPFNAIKKAINNKLWEGGQSNGYDSYTAAIGKYLFENLGQKNIETANLDDYKIIQFHPAYTYEDFVRGISVENNEDGKIEYKTQNRVLAEFALKALKNYNNFLQDKTTYTNEFLLNDYFNQFLDKVNDDIENNDGFYKLTKSVGITFLEEDAFRYKSHALGWNQNGNRMLFEDIKQAFLDGNVERQDLKHNKNLSGLAKHHASYFVRVLNLFQKFLNDKKLTFENKEIQKEPLKNYVLIIDEINRANLSSVLGELIYALEYRGESVESMYEINKSREIILPPNLFIIGTMNTADRSVGQIDYAIRRRFAFVDVLPKVLLEEELNTEDSKTKLYFKEDYFLKVQALFLNKAGGNSEYLSEEFNAKDVQLGHSYFIYEEGKFEYNLTYEIKPILREYVTDGILKASALKDIIDNL
ncbi:AAA family ATPase [Tenacibaculum aquimarinum]|uniref:AAA family ATPase n=1 Tax=Tenacibaculum aquimarinum TaxID=2910675 RepID=UPI001F0AA882|nr:AAA family ATPase [Tenacibaculum aquimarinum]MCH3884396.1 AAA family ATPase [Tenacibaculum aquimarinum]